MKQAIQERLTRKDIAELIEIKKRMARMSVEAREIADSSGLTRRELAELMGNASTSTLQRLLNGAAYNATFDTLARFAWACGYELRAHLVKRDEVLDFAAYARRAQAGNGRWPSVGVGREDQCSALPAARAVGGLGG